MREETTTSPLASCARLSVLLGAMVLLGVLATAGGAVEGNTTLVSVNSAGNQANGGSSSPAISSDGRFVAFVSSARNLVRNDINGRMDAFVPRPLEGDHRAGEREQFGRSV